MSNEPCEGCEAAPVDCKGPEECDQMPMKTAIGTKIVRFKPMSKVRFHLKFRGGHPFDSSDDPDGYHVQYDNPNNSVYDSWSPKKVFDDAYRSLDGGLTFGDALFFLKQGKKVARKGWNGKGMWICLGKGHAALDANSFWNEHTKAFAEQNGGSAEVLPYIIFKTADGKILMSWLASQTDTLSEDWCIID